MKRKSPSMKKSMMKRGRYDSDKTPYYEKPIKKIKQHAVINLDDFVDSDDADSDDADSDDVDSDKPLNTRIDDDHNKHLNTTRRNDGNILLNLSDELSKHIYSYLPLKYLTNVHKTTIHNKNLIDHKLIKTYITNNERKIYELIRDIYIFNNIKYNTHPIEDFKKYCFICDYGNNIFLNWDLNKINIDSLNIDMLNNKFFGMIIETLPESFGNIKVGGNLCLSGTKIRTLPESFGNIKVGGNLDLSNNELESLPESFGNIKFGGNLDLSRNQLESLPESFGNIKFGGNFDLSNNKLESLPKSFGNIKFGGNLDLSRNQLNLLPESFKKIKFGGILYLHNNKLDDEEYKKINSENDDDKIYM